MRGCEIGCRAFPAPNSGRELVCERSPGAALRLPQAGIPARPWRAQRKLVIERIHENVPSGRGAAISSRFNLRYLRLMPMGFRPRLISGSPSGTQKALGGSPNVG
jgi:hypothetical protein